jgi:predicted anti-sigma-YlaC factor YlaD
MDCQRAEELLSDHLEGSLHPLLGAELEAHLASCEECQELRGALADVVEALRSAPELETPVGLAERAARAARTRPRPIEIRPALVLPQWLNAAAAGFALIALGAALAVVGPERGARAAQRLVGQTVTAGSSLIERKDRLLEDVRVLGVVLSTAFEGRIERVNERVNDYKRLLERRKPSPEVEPKQGSETRPPAVRVATSFRTGAPRAA